VKIFKKKCFPSFVYPICNSAHFKKNHFNFLSKTLHIQSILLSNLYVSTDQCKIFAADPNHACLYRFNMNQYKMFSPISQSLLLSFHKLYSILKIVKSYKYCLYFYYNELFIFHVIIFRNSMGENIVIL
jgi:hypothetical protein